MDLVIIGLPSLFIRNFASRSSFDPPTFSVSLNVGEHLEGAAAVAMAEVTVEMATKEVVAVLHEARMDLHANDHSGTRLPGRLDFLYVIITLWKPKTLGLNAKILEVHTVLKH